MGREVEGGFRMGNTCKSMTDSCQWMAKTTIIFKVISLQLIKIIGGKKSNISMCGGGTIQSFLQTGECLAAAAKLLQSCPTLCDPIDGSPPGSSVPGILQARILEWVAISFSNARK